MPTKAENRFLSEETLAEEPVWSGPPATLSERGFIALERPDVVEVD